jgi:hypothetical protein
LSYHDAFIGFTKTGAPIMTHIKMNDIPVNEITDENLTAWMEDVKGGYKLRKDVAAIWVAVARSIDQQGPPMTVRGLFYNCENVYHVVHKSESGYNKVQRQVLAMRRAGVLPYHFISDSTRWIRKPQSFSGLRSYFENGRKAYRRALWDNQNAYIQIWCEKDAIAGILHDITAEWDVPLLVVRGYSSETFAYAAAEDIKSQKKPAYAYYFGDWDKHGVQISKDIERKLIEFGAITHFKRVTVLPEQINEWNLPTRPTKDPGWGECVEVDAIPANKLRELVTDCISTHINQEELHKTLQIEKFERESLENIFNNWGLASDSYAEAAK